MAKTSRATAGRSKNNAKQPSSKPVTAWKHLDASEVQLVRERLTQWRTQIERRHPRSTIISSNSQLKTHWQRATTPAQKMRRRTWEKHVEALLQAFQNDWNGKNSNSDSPLEITWELLKKGPPSELLDPGASADLQTPPLPSVTSRAHLRKYLNELRTRVDHAQGIGHITAERALRETIVTILESLEAWEIAAHELQFVIQIHEQLCDWAYAARALLRRGIACYHSEAFEDARFALERAIEILKKRLPKNAALRTHVRIFDYLGLCYIKLRNPKKALSIYLDREHIRRAQDLSSPLADASREVRLGIAYFELKQATDAKAAFLKGIALRVSVGAFAEASRGLRYLGLWYRERRPEKALCIWDLCLHLARKFADDGEQTKLHFYRGTTFHELWTQSKPGIGHTASPSINCELTDEMFPDRDERLTLQNIAAQFRDPFRPWFQHQYLGLARFSYEQCIEIGKRRRLLSWVQKAETELGSLPEET